MSNNLSKTEDDLVAAAAEFAARDVRPDAAGWEKARALPAEMFERAAAAGLTSAILPREGKSVV